MAHRRAQSGAVQRGMHYRSQAAAAIVFQSSSHVNVVLAGRREPFWKAL